MPAAAGAAISRSGEKKRREGEKTDEIRIFAGEPQYSKNV